MAPIPLAGHKAKATRVGKLGATNSNLGKKGGKKDQTRKTD